MTSGLTLSHKDAFDNISSIESFEELQRREVHGFGVRGKHFVLIKRQNSFLSRIWFSFLKFFRIIKVDPKSIERLKEATITHIRQDDYKEWSKTNGKITKLGIQNLIDRNAELENMIQEYSAKPKVEELTPEVKRNLQEMQTIIATLRVQLASAQAENEHLHQDLPSQSAKGTIFEHKDGDSAEVKMAEAIKSKEHYKRKWKDAEITNTNLARAWTHAHPELSVKDYLKQHHLEIEGKRRKSLVNEPAAKVHSKELASKPSGSKDAVSLFTSTVQNAVSKVALTIQPPGGHESVELTSKDPKVKGVGKKVSIPETTDAKLKKPVVKEV